MANFHVDNIAAVDPSEFHKPSPLYNPAEHGLAVYRIHEAIEPGSGKEGYTKEQLSQIKETLPGQEFCDDHGGPVGHVIEAWDDGKWAWARVAIYKKDAHGKQIYDGIMNGEIKFASLKWQQTKPRVGRVSTCHYTHELSATKDPVERGAVLVYAHSKTANQPPAAAAAQNKPKPKPDFMREFTESGRRYLEQRKQQEEATKKKPEPAAAAAAVAAAKPANNFFGELKRMSAKEQPAAGKEQQEKKEQPEKQAPAAGAGKEQQEKKQAAPSAGKKQQQQEQPKKSKKPAKDEEDEEESSDAEPADKLAEKEGMTPQALALIEKMRRKAQRERRERTKVARALAEKDEELAAAAEKAQAFEALQEQEAKKYQESGKKLEPFLQTAKKQFKMEGMPGVDEQFEAVQNNPAGAPMQHLLHNLFRELAERDARLEDLNKKLGGTERKANNLSSLVAGKKRGADSTTTSKKPAASADAESDDDAADDSEELSDVSDEEGDEVVVDRPGKKSRQITGAELNRAEREMPEQKRKVQGRKVVEPHFSKIPTARTAIFAHSNTKNGKTPFAAPVPSAVADDICARGVNDPFFSQFSAQMPGIVWNKGSGATCKHESAVEAMIKNGGGRN